MFDFKFEKKYMLPGLNVIRMKGREPIVGYSFYYTDEKAWTWIRKDRISKQFYKTEQEAIEALATAVILEKMDANADKMGVGQSMINILGQNKENEDNL